jgi:hypothetical protein
MFLGGINMKAIFEFNLDNEIDRVDYRVQSNAGKLLGILKELDKDLFTQLNVGTEELSDEMYEFVVSYNNYFMSLVKKYLGIKKISEF